MSTQNEAPAETAAGREGTDLPRSDADEILPGHEMAPVPTVSGWFGRGVDALGLVFASAFLISTAIILLEIVVRTATGQSFLWAHDTTIFLCGLAFIFGGLYALARDRHIRVVLIYDAVHGRAKRLLNIVLSLIGLVATLFFAYGGWLLAEKGVFAPDGSIRLETTGSALRLPYYGLSKAFLFLVVCLMVVQFVTLIINYARGLGDTHADDTAGEGEPR